jgi:hypothetical protein
MFFEWKPPLKNNNSVPAPFENNDGISPLLENCITAQIVVITVGITEHRFPRYVYKL